MIKSFPNPFIEDMTHNRYPRLTDHFFQNEKEACTATLASLGYGVFSNKHL